MVGAARRRLRGRRNASGERTSGRLGRQSTGKGEARLTEQVLDVSNDVAAELASIGDGILDALRERLEINILLRGNRLTIAGDDVHVAEARAVVDELVELVETGQEIGPSTVDAVLQAIDQAQNVQDVFSDVVWRHRGKQITPKT